VAAGLAAVDMDGHGGLRLTEAARPVLRGEQTLRLRRDPERRRRREARERRATPAGMPLDTEGSALWERLRRLRRGLAESQGVPPYVIFGDATLRELVSYRPRDLDQLAHISGVGAMKLERYGADFLAALAEHESEHGRPADLPPLPEAPVRASPTPRPRDEGPSPTALESLELCRAGKGVEEIAALRGLKPSTVSVHLEECIAAGLLGLDAVVDLDPAELRAIQFALDQLPADAPPALKPVYEALEGRYSYEVLRCVRAALRVEG
jgi:ATP-dependent DNA helicase RecQ